MDVARELLNNLMGRDRNKPKGDLSGRDHYSNRDVCKPYLICFCFNTLFPNTVYDEGPCNKRHDTYLKNMFDNDLNRKDFEKEYIKQCINWIQKRISDVEQKIKKNQGVIETKTTFTGDRPKGVLDRIIAIDQDIQNMMKQAQIFGQNGQIDQSSRCLEEVQRLRERRRQIQSMNDTTNSVLKQQKICQICGAIQTINDTEKRIQTHLQGKIHQGFLKLRHQVETLKVRLEIINQMDPNQKNKQNQKEAQKEKQTRDKQKQKEKQREREREKQKQRQRQREKQKQKERQKEKQRQRERQREKQKERERHKQPDRERQRQRQRYGDDISKKKSYQMQQQREKRSHSHKKKKDKDKQRQKQRSRDKKHKKQDKYKDRERDDKYYDSQRHEKKQKKKHKKDRSKSRSRDKYPDRQRQRRDF